MARDSGGNYTLAAGNPVVTGTTIESAWANGTMSDLATAMTDSLSRTGLGGMLAPLRGLVGSALAPAFSFSGDSNTGMYSPGADQLAFATSGAVRFSIGNTGAAVLNIPNTLPGVLLSSATGVSSLYLRDGGARDLELSMNVDATLQTRFASSLVLGTNTTTRLTINATGNFTISAPSSGVALAVTGPAAGTSQTWTDGTRAVTLNHLASRVDFGTTTGDTLSLLSNGSRRIEIGAAGNVTINAPASGTALDVTGAATLTQRLFFGTGPALRLASTNFNYEFRSVDASGTFELARNDGVSAVVMSVNTNRAVTINGAATGTTLVLNAPLAGGTTTLDIGAVSTNPYNLRARSVSLSTNWAAFFDGTSGGAGIVIAGSLPTGVAAGQLGIGSTTSASASAGGGAALPATVAGFLEISVAGTTRKIPFYAA